MRTTLVREGGLEPPCLAAVDFEPTTSTVPSLSHCSDAYNVSARNAIIVTEFVTLVCGRVKSYALNAEHQANILHGRPARPLTKIIEAGSEHGVTMRIMAVHTKLEGIRIRQDVRR